MNLMNQLLSFFIFSSLFHSFQSQTRINTTWEDDFAVDSDKLNGWNIINQDTGNLNNPTILGNTFKAHGPFRRPDVTGGGRSRNNYMRRIFACLRKATVSVTFYYAYCGTEVDPDPGDQPTDIIETQILIGNETYNSIDNLYGVGTQISDDLFDANLDNNVLTNTTNCVNDQNWNYTVKKDPTSFNVSELQEFQISIKHRFGDKEDEFSILFNLTIECISDPTSTTYPTAPPTYTADRTTSTSTKAPTTYPTTTYPTAYPTTSSPIMESTKIPTIAPSGTTSMPPSTTTTSTTTTSTTTTSTTMTSTTTTSTTTTSTTSELTTNPTTSIPTFSSTITIETNYTNNPSPDPTNAPTNDSTAHPIDDPTNDQTIDPSIDTTNHPISDSTSYPTTSSMSNPTGSPTEPDIAVAETTTTGYISSGEAGNVETNDIFGLPSWIVFTAGGCAVLCICCFCGIMAIYCFRKKRIRDQDDKYRAPATAVHQQMNSDSYNSPNATNTTSPNGVHVFHNDTPDDEAEDIQTYANPIGHKPGSGENFEQRLVNNIAAEDVVMDDIIGHMATPRGNDDEDDIDEEKEDGIETIEMVELDDTDRMNEGGEGNENVLLLNDDDYDDDDVDDIDDNDVVGDMEDFITPNGDDIDDNDVMGDFITPNVDDIIWNGYVDKHGQEPMNVTQLQQFAKSDKKYNNLTYYQLKEIFDNNTGKGRVKQDMNGNNDDDSDEEYLADYIDTIQ